MSVTEAVPRRVLHEALEQIRSEDRDGVLRAEAVVQAAKPTKSPLHGLFEWDDKKAGHQYRLDQARMLIRRVRILNPEDLKKPPTPAYVALKQDLPKGGYRATRDVVKSDELLDSLRDTALSELRGWVKRYQVLTDLVGPIADHAGLEMPLQ